MKRKYPGFTIVEVSIVIAVLAILASIAIVSFGVVQTKSRDNKRQGDIQSMISALEAFYDEKGEYPTDSYLNYWAQPGRVLENAIDSSSAILGTETTYTDLKTMFKSPIHDSFGDPTRTSPDYLFGNVSLSYTGPTHRYYYLGGAITTQGGYYGSPMYFTGKSGAFRCDYKVDTPSSEGATSYALGYYEEATDKWIFYLGRKGIKITIYDTYDTSCFSHVIVRNA